MAYKQIKQPNVNVAAQYAMCLAYIQSAFGTPHVEPNAWSAWNASKKKHTGTPPNGVHVPIWFSGYGGLGHVADYYNGKVYSSPWHKGKTTHDTMNSIAETEKIYGVKYVGWSEDIVGTTVISPVTTSTPSQPKRISKSGTATVLINSLNVRNSPDAKKGQIVATYNKGQKFNYDSYIITNGYVWLSYMSNSKLRRYVAEGPYDNNPKNIWVKGGVS